jgi:hypothetical protein
MKKTFIFMTFTLLQIGIFAQDTGHFLKIFINDRSELDTLTQMVSIDNVIGNEVFAYANSYQLKKLTHSQFLFEEFEYHLTQSVLPITMATTVEEMANWDRYPIYSVYNQLMANFATNYPNLCKLDTIGTSIQNRNMLALKVTADINTSHPKPEVFFSSTMHGDEVTGWILCMRLADYLLSKYAAGTDPRIKNMLDSIAIFIAPNTNPDGTYYSGNNIVGVFPVSRRDNINGYDLNRNFPDPRVGLYPGGTRQKETTIMMDYAEAKNFVLSINYHGGAEVANYPWDTWTISRKHADHNWYDQICRNYATLVQTYGPSNYFRDFNNGVTHGASWYQIAGGRQDYMNYWHNCREITLEVSPKTPGSETMPNYWNYNKEAMLGYIENVKYGVRGFVTSTCGEPLSAKITVVGHDKDNSQVVTNPEFGNYYRMIEAGTYSLLFESDGYQPQTITGVSVQQNKTAILNITLQSTQIAIPYISPLNIVFETKETTGDTIITISNIGNGGMNFTATVEDEQNNSWLSLLNNSGILCNNEMNDIILSYNFSSLPCDFYETNVKIDVDGNEINIPISILYSGCEEDNGIPYIIPKEIVLETEEIMGSFVVTMRNIGKKEFDYNLSLEPTGCDEWLSIAHDSGILEPEEQVEIILYYDFNSIAKEIHKAILNISAVDSIIRIPITIDLMLNILTPETNEIKIYPNPTAGEFQVSGFEFQVSSIEIFDVYGRKIIEDKTNLTVLRSFYLTDFPAGIYFLKIETEKGTVIQKVIKN